jgi:superfamily II DNA or RNA helicase
MNKDTIIVESIDNSFLYLDTDPAIARELSDYFSFMTPNYRFMPKYKNGLWDGKSRLYKIIGSTLPAGLYGILLKFASDNDYSVIDRRTPIPIETPLESEIEDFLIELNPYADRKQIQHHDYQIEAVKSSILNSRATIVSATSSGKSLIIYSLIRWYQKKIKGKILVLVPTVNLVSQMHSDFDDYSEVDGFWDAEEEVHKIQQGRKKNSEKQIYVSTWQSVYKMPEEYFDQFDVILCDEVHGASAASIIGIMEKSKNAFIRIGFTGTLKNMKLHQLTIVGLFGDIKRVTSARDLMDRGFITKLDVRFMVLKYNQSICKEINRKVVEKITPTGKKIYRKNYIVEMDFITQCMARNLYICNLVSVLPGNTLVLFNKVQKHGKPLYELMKNRLDNKKNVYYISGETKVDNRERIRGSIEKEKDSVLVASYGTLSTGVNIKSLQFVVFASPYKSEIKVLQSIGRILRKKEGKNKAVLFDIVDDFRYNKYVNYSFKHFQKRFDIYKNEKFPIDISEFKLM